MTNEKDYNSISVRDLGLSNGATNTLLGGSIETLQQLIDVYKKGNLMKYRNLGKTRYLEIVNKLYEIEHSDLVDAINDENALKEIHANISKQISSYKNSIAALEMEKKICEEQLQKIHVKNVNR
ncbi:MAG: hypothetical protein K5912_02895 [Alphaproteobacteria bacterium]|nr:hypothetical protein [Alphaproteobacteria bacterium]